MSKFKGLFEQTDSKSLASHKEISDEEDQLQTTLPIKAKIQIRSVGKRSDPQYEQVTAYVRKDTYKNVKIALLEDNQRQEFSELVEKLLSEWLATRS